MIDIDRKLKKIGFKLPSEVSLEINAPKDYCSFINQYSGQELHDTFLLYSKPTYYYDIFGVDIESLDGVYLFASDNSEYLFGFNSKNNWEIVEIDSSGETLNTVAQTFTEFINQKLDEIIEIETYRKNH